MSHAVQVCGTVQSRDRWEERGALARSLLSEEQALTPSSVVKLSATAMPSTDHAALTLVRKDRAPTTAAASDDLPVRVDHLQYRVGRGPCLDAAVGAEPVLATGDLSRDPRWPDFGPRCVRETSIRSMLSLKVPIGGSDRAALNYYATEPDAFTAEDLAIATAWLPFVALAVETQLREHDVHHLRVALETNRTISTAVGILMARHHLDADEAFALLRQVSMHTNTKLREVACDVQRTGALPERVVRPPRDRSRYRPDAQRRQASDPAAKHRASP
jgi:hypothetical protein